MSIQSDEKAIKINMKNVEFYDRHLSSRLITQDVTWPAENQSF